MLRGVRDALGPGQNLSKLLGEGQGNHQESEASANTRGMQESLPESDVGRVSTAKEMAGAKSRHTPRSG